MKADESRPNPVQCAESQGIPVEVRVTAAAAGCGADFSQQWKFKNEAEDEWRGGDIELPYGKDHQLQFELVDDSGLGTRFKGDVRDAFGAIAGQGCPGPGSDGGEIDFRNSNVAGNGLKLFIRDCNHKAGPLSYALYFDSDEGDRIYDPVIQNGGGGPPLE